MKTNAHFSFVIADDDKEDQDMLLQAFAETTVNYESTSVFNGIQLMDHLVCRNKCKKANPDFIFLDINMPKKNGFDVLRELKSNKELQKIPVYIFSTYCTLKDQKMMLELGAEKCYIKPYFFADYKKMVNEIITS